MGDETAASPDETAPGWSPDPYHRHELRYWDGAGWTDQVSDEGRMGVDAPEAVSPWAAMSATAPPAEQRTTAAPAPAASRAPAASVAPTATATATPPAPEPPLAAAPAPSPSPATRPPGPSWAWDQPPAPSGGPAPVPPAVPPPLAPPGVPAYDLPPGAAAKKPGRIWKWVAVAAVALVLLGVGYLRLQSPERIDAGPPAPTPAGFRLVETDEYRFAVPEAWSSEVVTAEDRERIADAIDDLAPGAGEDLEASAESIEGTQVVAVDAATAENVQVIRYEALRGDPRDPDVLAEIRETLGNDNPGLVNSGIAVIPTDVHGFPAAEATYHMTLGSITVAQASTVIQTGDHVYLVTVTSRSADRAAALSDQIVPTFDPV